MTGRVSARSALAVVALAMLAASLWGCGGDSSDEDAAAAPLMRGERSPAGVLIVLESSSAMGEDDRLERAGEAIKAVARDLPAADSVGLATYSDRFRPLVPIAPARSSPERLEQALDRLKPGGPAALNDAALEAYGVLRELSAPDRIEAVVLIAHSADSGSAASAERVSKVLAAQPSATTRARMMTVAYDGDDAATTLAGFAKASGGNAYESGPDELEATLRSAWRGL